MISVIIGKINYTIDLDDNLLDAEFRCSNWKLHLFQLGLILILSSDVLMSVLQMINHLLPHQARLSLGQFCVDLVQSFWLIGQIIRILSYPGNIII